MQNHQRQHYEEFYTMLSDGSSIKTTRRECFAPAEPVTANNPYPQRWYYSPDQQKAIRLPRNELGEQIGKENATDLKTEERVEERKNLCIGQTSHASCPITCDRCSIRDNCDFEYRTKNSVDCKRKCEGCYLYMRRTIELDKPLCFNDDGTEVTFELADEKVDIEGTYSDSEQQHAIAEIIASLDPNDRELWFCLVQKIKKNEVADRLHLTVDGVYYRQKRLEHMLHENEALKKIFENF